MSVYIGKMQPDGRVRCIKLLSDADYYGNLNILKRFYTKEHRLDALLELGNIRYLRPSPYGKSRCMEDPVNCRALFRDEYESRKWNEARVNKDREMQMVIADYTYLWQDGKWYFLSKATYEEADGFEFEKKDKADVLEGIEWQQLKSDGSLDSVSDKSVSVWSDLQSLSNREGKTYFMFRNKKLFARITPQKTKQCQTLRQQ